MGFLKRHMGLIAVVAITLVTPAVGFSLLLGGDVKAVGIGFVVVLAVLLTVALFGGYTLDSGCMVPFWASYFWSARWSNAEIAVS